MEGACYNKGITTQLFKHLMDLTARDRQTSSGIWVLDIVLRDHARNCNFLQ